SLARPAVWQGRSFQLFDTGGLYGASEDPLHELVVEHGKRAIVGADLLVLVADGRDGLVSGDETIARELREAGRPLILAINKIDDKRARHAKMDFYRLGIEPVVEISAEHGTGVGDLLDEIVSALRIHPDESQTPNPESHSEISVAIVGRPNVGKSSLVNRLLRAERVLVSDMPGTTRDAIDVPLAWHQRRFRIVDTAGMRRPGRVGKVGARHNKGGLGKVEAVSVALAKEAIADADVVALIIDSREGSTDQDAAIGGEADRAGRGIVIVANKWDLVRQSDSNFSKTFDDALRRKMRFLDYAPI